MAFRILTISITLLTTWFLGLALFAQDRKEPKKLDPSVFMRVKLRESARVLEGTVTRDFDLVARGAEAMEKMSRASNWPNAKDATYTHYGAEFRRLCRKLSKLAKEQNAEGVAYVQAQLNASCIQCHDYVFKSLTKNRDPSSPFRLIPNARIKER